MASLKYYNKTTNQWEYVSSSSGSSDILIDNTLTQAGQAADAKAVGDVLATKQPKGNYATEDFVENKIKVDITEQVNKAETAAAQAQSMASSATMSSSKASSYAASANSFSTKADNAATRAEEAATRAEEAATRAEEAAANAGNGSGSNVDLSGYATTEYVDNAISSIPPSGTQVQIITWEADD